MSPEKSSVSRRSIIAAGGLTAAATSFSLAGVGAPASSAAVVSTPAARATGKNVLFREDFENVFAPTGFTHDAPKGWTSEAHGFRTGEGRWSGWTFTTVREWTWAVGTDERHWFPLGFGTLAVLESEHHRLAQGSNDELNASLTTPAISVRGHREIELAFTSHYKQGRAEQSAAVTVSFDGGAKKDVHVYSADKYSSHETFRVAVPAGASKVQFSFEYRKGHNDKWWAIDNVEVRVPLPELAPGTKPLSTIDIISDIHVSDSSDRYDRVVNQLNAMTPAAGALVINGDGVELGLQAHYDKLAAALKANPHVSGNVLYSVGNHEMLGKEGSDVYLNRYLKVAGEKKPYFERVVNGIPLIVTGLEYFSDPEREGREPYNNFSAAQLAWLDSRLKHWNSKKTPVFVFNHFPLPYTVSQTHSAWEQNNYENIDAFNAVIGKYSNIIMFTGHTHDDINMNDWWGTYRIADPKNPAGFPVVNTAAVLNAYVPDGDYDTNRVTGDNSAGIRVLVFADRIRVVALDFVGKKEIKFQDFALEELLSK